MKGASSYVIGMDFGTDSARAVLVDTRNGNVVAAHTAPYRRWAQGKWCNAAAHQYRQNAEDYLESLREVLKSVLEQCPDKGAVRAIAVDTTASTPCLVDETLTPLHLKPGFEDNPDAMFVIWKDHTGAAESDAIIAAAQGTPYLSHTGGSYTPENFWSKTLHVLKDASLRAAAYTSIELCDYIPAVLTGLHDPAGLRMSHCAAGAKWMFSEQWGGYPPLEWFLGITGPLDGFGQYYSHLPAGNHYCTEAAGTLCPEWAADLGLSTEVMVGVGNIDSYAGAVGGGAAYRRMSITLGTSAGCLPVVPSEIMAGRLVPGVFAQLEGLILKGFDGFEVGLSAFGDDFAWVSRITGKSPAELDAEAQKLPRRLDAPLATDHLNGRRSPYTDVTLTGTITGLRLGTTAAEIYYAIVEATAFGFRRIFEHLESHGVEVGQVVAIGGIARKSPFVVQMLADVCSKTIGVSQSKDATAIGSAIHAAVVAGIYPDIASAQAALCAPVSETYSPCTEGREIIEERYRRYLRLAEGKEIC